MALDAQLFLVGIEMLASVGTPEYAVQRKFSLQFEVTVNAQPSVSELHP